MKRFLLAVSFCFLVVSVSQAEDPKELVFIFQKQKDPAEMKTQAEQVGQYLSQHLGMPVKTQVPSDYAASVQALVSNKADIAYVDSMAFLLARRDADADLLLAEKRRDPSGVERTDYDSVFVVKSDSVLRSMEDIRTQAPSLRMVFTSPTSTSGYLMAYSRFVEEGLLKPEQDPKDVFDSVSFGGSYTQALDQVLMGKGDVAAVSYYAVEDPSATKYLPEEKLRQLRIVARTPGVPTHVIIARGGISDELNDRVKNAIMKLSDEHPELLEDIYGAATFAEVDADKHVQKAVATLSYTGLPLRGIVEKSIASLNK